MDPKALLDQFLGGGAAGAAGGGLGQLKQKFDTSALNSFGGGAALGGVLGLLLGNRKIGKMAGGAAGYGGAAVLGALALRAYQAYQQGRPAAQSAAPASLGELTSIPPQQLPHAQPAPDGTPFELTLMRAMIGVTKADGHVDAQEQQHVFEQVEKLKLDANAKAMVFDLLSKPLDLQTIDTSIGNEAQRAEVYLAARLATDADHPAERAYLDALASRLQIPAELRQHLDGQLQAAAAL
ncbi:MAG: tellurite resistance TerB family protein [Steroidobacteraceae bacterium]